MPLIEDCNNAIGKKASRAGGASLLLGVGIEDKRPLRLPNGLPAGITKFFYLYFHEGLFKLVTSLEKSEGKESQPEALNISHFWE